MRPFKFVVLAFDNINFFKLYNEMDLIMKKYDCKFDIDEHLSSWIYFIKCPSMNFDVMMDAINNANYSMKCIYSSNT